MLIHYTNLESSIPFDCHEDGAKLVEAGYRYIPERGVFVFIYFIFCPFYCKLFPVVKGNINKAFFVNVHLHEGASWDKEML